MQVFEGVTDQFRVCEEQCRVPHVVKGAEYATPKYMPLWHGNYWGLILLEAADIGESLKTN